MKPLFKKILIWSAILFGLLAITLFIFDIIVMPWYVKSDEKTVPNLVGLDKSEAEKMVLQNDMEPIFEVPRYSDDFPADHVIFQNPESGETVKVGRRVHLVISGGNPLTKMPYLIDKTLRDAKVSIERLGFQIGDVSKVKSEIPAGIVVEQYPKEGANLEKGTRVQLKISMGPNIGMVRVPDLLSLTLKEARETIQRNSLVVGKINYQESKTLLPNTVVAQYPAKNKLVNVGETIDLFITKNQD